MTELELRKLISSEYLDNDTLDWSYQETPKCRVNLLTEILELRNIANDLTNIKCIYLGDKRLDKELFIKVAKDYWYNNRYGIVMILDDLYLYVENGTYTRHEYDGWEWWVFVPFRTE